MVVGWCVDMFRWRGNWLLGRGFLEVRWWEIPSCDEMYRSDDSLLALHVLTVMGILDVRMILTRFLLFNRFLLLCYLWNCTWNRLCWCWDYDSTPIHWEWVRIWYFCHCITCVALLCIIRLSYLHLIKSAKFMLFFAHVLHIFKLPSMP